MSPAERGSADSDYDGALRGTPWYALKEYRDKRAPDAARAHRANSPEGQRKAPHFVIQHHAAISDHYHFGSRSTVRWRPGRCPRAIDEPEGQTDGPTDRDHPMDYEVRGRIPEGEYGAGPVIVWDRGTYTNESEHDMADGLKRGTCPSGSTGRSCAGVMRSPDSARTRTRHGCW